MKTSIETLKARGTGEMERGFVVRRTAADLRYVDLNVDPNERPARWCWLGNPETANSGPTGLARFCTLRSWLSPWSIDDSHANGQLNAAGVSVPMMELESGADDAVPKPHADLVYATAGSTDKCMFVIEGANHHYAGQPNALEKALNLTKSWLKERVLF